MIYKALAISVFGTLLSFIPVPQKENIYTLSEGQMVILYNAAQQAKQILPTSQAPAIQVTQISNAFDSIQKVLAVQYNNFHPDTTVKKK